MIYLDSTTILEVILGEAKTTSDCSFMGGYGEAVASSGSFAGSAQVHGSTNGVSAVTLVGAAGASNIRSIKQIAIENADTVKHTVTVRLNVSSTYFTIVSLSVASGSTLAYEDGLGWYLAPAPSTAVGSVVQSVTASTTAMASSPPSSWPSRPAA